MIIYRVYESKWGDVSEVRVYSNKEDALKEVKLRNSLYTHLDEEELILGKGDEQ